MQSIIKLAQTILKNQIIFVTVKVKTRIGHQGPEGKNR
jgi:hypothetical protein